MKTIIIFGAGGHSKVIIDLINELNIYTIIFIITLDNFIKCSKVII